jgi:hypothetical protein
MTQNGKESKMSDDQRRPQTENPKRPEGNENNRQRDWMTADERMGSHRGGQTFGDDYDAVEEGDEDESPYPGEGYGGGVGGDFGRGTGAYATGSDYASDVYSEDFVEGLEDEGDRPGKPDVHRDERDG